jgi:hypothetical protein
VTGDESRWRTAVATQRLGGRWSPLATTSLPDTRNGAGRMVKPAVGVPPMTAGGRRGRFSPGRHSHLRRLPHRYRLRCSDCHRHQGVPEGRRPRPARGRPGPYVRVAGNPDWRHDPGPAGWARVICGATILGRHLLPGSLTAGRGGLTAAAALRPGLRRSRFLPRSLPIRAGLG